jgi:tetratricopeptide (TPR) repeat protein
MRIWNLPKPKNLSLILLLMMTLSPPTRGTVIEPGSGSSEVQSIIENLLKSPDFESGLKPSGAESINSMEKAASASAMLEDRLRRLGEIAGIAPLAPRIIELIPDEPRIHYLYAIALASQGDADRAKKILSKVDQIHEKHLLGLLALSAIAKANNQVEPAVKYAEMAVNMAPEHPYGYNLLGQAQAAQGLYKEALSNFSAATKRAPQFTAAFSNLGSTYFLLGKLKEAKEAFSSSLELTARYCPALIGRASVSLQLSDAANAISDLKACIKDDTGQLTARRLLVSTYIQQGMLEKAFELATSSLAQDPPYFHLKLADIQLRMAKPQSARKHLKAIRSKDADAFFLLSLCDILDGNPKPAQANIQAAERLEPKAGILKLANQIFGFYDKQPVDLRELEALSTEAAIKPLAAFFLGNVYAADGEFAKTFTYWGQANNIIPGFNMDGLASTDLQAALSSKEQKNLSLGMLLYLRNFYRPALSEFGKALKANPDSFLANFLYAITLVQIDAANDPSSYLMKSIQTAPAFFPANYMLAEYYLKRKDIDKAVRYYTAAAESLPDQGVLMKLALIYENQGQLQQAETTYHRFIKYHPTSFLGYNQLAWLYAQQGRKLEEALDLARKADELRPGNASVNDTMGWILHLKKDYMQAELYLRKAIDASNGNNPEIRYHLAVVLHEQGKTQEAKQHLARAFELSDRFSSITQAKHLSEKLGVVISH